MAKAKADPYGITGSEMTGSEMTGSEMTVLVHSPMGRSQSNGPQQRQE